MTLLIKIATAMAIAGTSAGTAAAQSATAMVIMIPSSRPPRPAPEPPKDPAAMALCAKITEKLANAGDILDPKQASALRASQARVCAQKCIRWVLGEDEADAVAAKNNARLCAQLRKRLKGEGAPGDEIAANRLAASRDYFCTISGD